MPPSPSSLPSPQAVSAVRTYIRSRWAATICRSRDQAPGEIPLPLPYNVPCASDGNFRTMYYWDTYFTNLGLAHDGDVTQCRNNAENIMHIVERQGFFPNTTKVGMPRSQPPYASTIYRHVYAHTADRVWISRALRATEKEYAFWKTQRSTPNGLYHAAPHASPADVEDFYWVVRDRLRALPGDPVELRLALYHAMAEAESGCDFTPRFERRCADFNSLALSSMVFQMENDAAFFCSELGDGTGQQRWQARADASRARIQAHLWNEREGAFYDYDFVNARHSSVLGIECCYPLWVGAATPAQAERTRATVLPRLERAAGLTTCEPGPRDLALQWDHPNAWPPMQLIAWESLARYGYLDDARRIATKYVVSVTASFEATGQLWEKYHADDPAHAVTDEYAMPPMLGWTAGVFNQACAFLSLGNS